MRMGRRTARDHKVRAADELLNDDSWRRYNRQEIGVLPQGVHCLVIILPLRARNRTATYLKVVLHPLRPCSHPD